MVMAVGSALRRLYLSADSWVVIFKWYAPNPSIHGLNWISLPSFSLFWSWRLTPEFFARRRCCTTRSQLWKLKGDFHFSFFEWLPVTKKKLKYRQITEILVNGVKAGTWVQKWHSLIRIGAIGMLILVQCEQLPALGTKYAFCNKLAK